jgi:hypothetical protein
MRAKPYSQIAAVMPLMMAQRKITGGMVRSTRGQIRLNGNLQSLLAVSRPPRMGQKTYPHSNGTVHGQLSQSPLQRIEAADKLRWQCCYCSRLAPAPAAKQDLISLKRTSEVTGVTSVTRMAAA